MDTLMRTLKLFTLGILLVVGTALTAGAQTPEAKPQAPEQPGGAPAPQTPEPPPAEQPSTPPEPKQARSPKYFFNVSVGGQSKEQSFTDSSTFTIYNEPTGAVAAAHSIGGGTLFDVGAGARVWRNLGVAIAYSTLKNFNDATVSIRVPHPVVFGQSRTATATTADLEHSENAVHLQFMWMIPLTSKFTLTASAGPSFFTVRQTVATVQAPQDLRDQPPFTTVEIVTVSLTDVKDSPVGVNVGVDGTYLIRTIKGVGIGVGGFVRYAGASLDLPTTAGITRDTNLRTGGPQGGIGLRLQY
jgi:hypothetical protein